MLNGEWENVWEEAVLPCSKVLSRHLTGEPIENYENLSEDSRKFEPDSSRIPQY